MNIDNLTMKYQQKKKGGGGGRGDFRLFESGSNFPLISNGEDGKLFLDKRVATPG